MLRLMLLPSPGLDYIPPVMEWEDVGQKKVGVIT